MRDLHRRLEEQGQERLLLSAPTRDAKRLVEIAAAAERGRGGARSQQPRAATAFYPLFPLLISDRVGVIPC